LLGSDVDDGYGILTPEGYIEPLASRSECQGVGAGALVFVAGTSHRNSTRYDVLGGVDHLDLVKVSVGDIESKLIGGEYHPIRFATDLDHLL
jgi:hypothetical protein